MEEADLHCDLTQCPSFDLLKPYPPLPEAIADLGSSSSDLYHLDRNPQPGHNLLATPSFCNYVPLEARKQSLGLKRVLEWRTQGFSSNKKPLAAHGEQVNALLAKVSRPHLISSVSENMENIESSDIGKSRPHLSMPDVISILPVESEHAMLSLPANRKFRVSKYKRPSLASSPVASSNAVSRIPFKDNNNLGNKQKSVCATQTGAMAREALQSRAAFYSVMYRMKKKNAKQKGPWFDGVLVTRGSKCTLQDIEGKVICKGSRFGSTNLEVDAKIEISKYEVEVMKVASSEEYESGTLFRGCFSTDIKTVTGRINKEFSKRQSFVIPSSLKNKDRKTTDLHSRSLKPKK